MSAILNYNNQIARNTEALWQQKKACFLASFPANNFQSASVTSLAITAVTLPASADGRSL
jgi:hypothetical protein